MVGLGRFELPTSRLSGVRSNQLSYRPVLVLQRVIVNLPVHPFAAASIVIEPGRNAGSLKTEQDRADHAPLR